MEGLFVSVTCCCVTSICPTKIASERHRNILSTQALLWKRWEIDNHSSHRELCVSLGDTLGCVLLFLALISSTIIARSKIHIFFIIFAYTLKHHYVIFAQEWKFKNDFYDSFIEWMAALSLTQCVRLAWYRTWYRTWYSLVACLAPRLPTLSSSSSSLLPPTLLWYDWLIWLLSQLLTATRVDAGIWKGCLKAGCVYARGCQAGNQSYTVLYQASLGHTVSMEGVPFSLLEVDAS